ncbi:unnamed protein product [Calypogeia fissa]
MQPQVRCPTQVSKHPFNSIPVSDRGVGAVASKEIDGKRYVGARLCCQVHQCPDGREDLFVLEEFASSGQVWAAPPTTSVL